jgi:hypothetical protein
MCIPDFHEVVKKTHGNSYNTKVAPYNKFPESKARCQIPSILAWNNKQQQ